MVSVIMIYYTRGGKTKKMAKAILEGATAAGAEGTAKRAERHHG